MKTRTIAIIPARRGSKGIPGKNITPLAGKPLIQWTIEASLNARTITDTVVSSDDPKIISLSEKLGAGTVTRPAHLANDVAATEPCLVHALESIGTQKQAYDYLILLQPTSPLRGARDIDVAMSTLLKKHGQALISVCELDKNPLKSFVVCPSGNLRGIVNDHYPFMSRQALPKAYTPNGAIYIVEMALFLKNQRLFQEKTLPFMMSTAQSIDIDGYDDLEKAEHWLINKGRA